METLLDLKCLYEQDFVAWCEATVTRLKAGRLDVIDVEHLIEEIDSLGKRDRRELTSRLRVLLAHLLKRLYVDMPENFNGWELTIVEQRQQMQALLKDSPSLRPYLAEIVADVYLDSLDLVSTEYKQVVFPENCPFAADTNELLTQKYWAQ